MERPHDSIRWWAIGTSVTIAGVLVAARLASDGIEDTGDAVQHYMIARYAWSHPLLFLDRWGKPLFALLGSPFALLGYPGMAVFNGLLAVLTTAFATALLRRSGTWSMILFPPLVLLGPHMVHLLMNGMTEVLFGSLAVVSVVLLARERYWQAALITSLLPLARPEYVVFLPVVGVWLCLKRKWGALPVLATGIGLYTIVGWAVTGDPLCWPHNDPHANRDMVYAHGDALRFVLDSTPAFGWGLVVLFLLALCLWPLAHARDADERNTHRLLLVAAALPAMLIVAVHAYLWATGTHGSAGLVRVLCTATPLAALFALFTLGRLLQDTQRKKPWLVAIPATAAIGATLVQTLLFAPILQRQAPDQEVLHAACDVAEQYHRTGDRVFSSHPYTAFRLGLDGFDTAAFRMLWGFDGMGPNVPSRPGDIVVWESQMGPNECGVPLDRFLEDTSFTVLGVFEPAQGHLVIGERPFEFWTFQRSPAHRSNTTDTLFSGIAPHHAFNVRQDTATCNIAAAWCGDREFPWTAEHIPCPEKASIYDEMICTLHLAFPTEQHGDVMLVLKQTHGEEMTRYDERRLKDGDNRLTFRIPPCAPDIDQVLYFWVPGSTPIRVEAMVLTRSRVRQVAT